MWLGALDSGVQFAYIVRMQSGPKQFRDWIARRFPGSARPQRDAAAHFGWDETFLSRLLAGRQTPGLTNALRIERETGIPVEAWASSQLDESADRAVTDAQNQQ